MPSNSSDVSDDNRRAQTGKLHSSLSVGRHAEPILRRKQGISKEVRQSSRRHKHRQHKRTELSNDQLRRLLPSAKVKVEFTSQNSAELPEVSSHSSRECSETNIDLNDCRTLHGTDEVDASSSHVNLPALDDDQIEMMGYRDCAREAIRFLTERARLSPTNAVITGIRELVTSRERNLPSDSVTSFDNESSLRAKLDSSDIENTKSDTPLLETLSARNPRIAQLTNELLSLLNGDEFSDDELDSM